MPPAEVGRLRENLSAALDLDARASHRLGKAGTSLTISNGTADSVTLLLDRDPPEISTDEHAEITLELDADQIKEFARGHLVVANCLMLATATFDGPIRKYLAVDPILRGLLRRVAGEDDR